MWCHIVLQWDKFDYIGVNRDCVKVKEHPTQQSLGVCVMVHNCVYHFDDDDDGARLNR